VIHFTDSPPLEDVKTIAKDKKKTTFIKGTRSQTMTYTDYEQLAVAIAKKYDFDPELIKAVIEAESGWNPRAISKRGALGLMQIMPETAEYLGVQNPFDPEENINAGVRYLKLLFEKFGSIRLALAAYNAGPTVVQRYKGVPPYLETNNYIKNILYQYKDSRSHIYRVVLDDGTILFTNSPVYLNNLSSF
jgi:hypothetical protein